MHFFIICCWKNGMPNYHLPTWIFFQMSSSFTFLSFLKIFLLVIYFLILQRKKNMIELSENNKSSMENQNQKQTFICHICEEKFEQCAFEAHFPTCAKQKPVKCELEDT